MLKTGFKLFSDTEPQTPVPLPPHQGEKFRPGDGGPIEPTATAFQVLALLGPLVPPVLRRADGSLDLTKCPTANFTEFRDFLITQVKADGVAFNEYLLDSYHKVLAKEEYRPLLEELLSTSGPLTPAPLPFGGEGSQKTPLAPRSGERGRGEGCVGLLSKLTAEIIEVSAQKFVSSQIGSETGRQRIRSILSDKESYTQGIRADVAKAVAQVGYEMGASAKNFNEFHRHLSWANYGNLGVDEADLKQVEAPTHRILEEVARLEKNEEDLKAHYIDAPEKVIRFAGLERDLGRKIQDEEIREKARFVQEHGDPLNPVQQARVHLARLWLMVVDDQNWDQSNAYKTGSHGAFLLKRIEDLQKKLEGIGPQEGEAKFLKICEEVRDFLNGGLNVTGEGAGRELKDFFAPGTVSMMMEPLPQAHRAPFDELKQWVDEILYASEMGETLSTARAEVRKQYLTIEKDGEKWIESAQMERLYEAKHQFLKGLDQVKRSLWYAYKQHKLLSRGISQVASLFDGGDIAEIREGQQALDQLIKEVEEAKDPRQLEAAVAHLQTQLKEDGKIYRAIRAAEMEGKEQLLGLGQTILILMASRGIYRGFRPLKTVQSLASPAAVSRSISFGEKFLQAAKAHPLTAAKGFGLGAYLSGAENVLAVASGEVRPKGEHWSQWAKDSFATGAAMALFAPFATHYGSPPLRYGLSLRTGISSFSGGVKVAGRIGGDILLETAEEWVDAWSRAKLDDTNAVIGFDQAREIAMVSGLGGFTQMGVIAEMLKRPGVVGGEGAGSGGNGKKGNGPAMENSESLTPPSLLPRSSRRGFDLGFLQMVMDAPSAWLSENRTLVAQMLLVSMVDVGIPPGPNGKGRNKKNKTLLEKIDNPALNKHNAQQIFQALQKRLKTAQKGSPIIYQTLEDVPRLFSHTMAEVRQGAVASYLMAMIKLPNGDPKSGDVLAQLEYWRKTNFLPAEFREIVETEIQRWWSRLPVGHPRWKSRLEGEIKKLRNSNLDPKEYSGLLAMLQQGLKHLVERKDLLLDLYYILEAGKNGGDGNPELHQRVQVLQTLVMHSLHSGMDLHEAAEELPTHGAFLKALVRLYEHYQNPGFESEVLIREMGKIIPALTPKQWSTFYGELTPEVAQSLGEYREPPSPVSSPRASLRPAALSEQARNDFKTLMILENLGVSMGNYAAAEALYDLAKKQLGGNDVYAVKSLIKIGRAGYAHAWEMLSALAEDSDDVVLELQLEVQENRSAGGLEALQKAGEKNPQAAAAAKVLRRIRRNFVKDGEGSTTPFNTMAIGLESSFHGNNIDLSQVQDWLSRWGWAVGLGAVGLLGALHVARTIYQGRRRSHLVLRAFDGDESAYREIHEQAKSGDRKALAALADVAERVPRAVLDIEELTPLVPYPEGIAFYLKNLNTRNYTHYVQGEKNPLALQALLIMGAAENPQAVNQLKGIKFYDFFRDEGFFPLRAYLLKQVATLYKNPSAESALLQAHPKFDWGQLSRGMYLWPVAQFFSTKGFGRELNLILTGKFEEVISKFSTKKGRSRFVGEVLTPAAVMGNPSAVEILNELHPNELPLPNVLSQEGAAMLAVMAECDNEFAWAELRARAQREDIPIWALIHLSNHGYSRADVILNSLEAQDIQTRLADPEAHRSLVELEIWGHLGARKLILHLVNDQSGLEEKLEHARRGPRAPEEFNTVAGRLDQEFKKFILNYSRLSPGLRNHFRQLTFKAWGELFESERVHLYQNSFKEVGEFTHLPIPFALKVAQEKGFHTLALKDAQTRRMERSLLGKGLGVIGYSL